MRTILLAVLALCVAGCLSEKGTSPGSTPTFIRYYNGGNNDEAVAIEETADKGFIILASTKIQKAEADIPVFKIKMIRTDPNGNPIWTRIYPDITDKVNNYSAASLQILANGGYVVVGNDIQSDGTKKVLLMTVEDSKGDATKVQLASSATSQEGRAVAVNAKGNYLVLSTSGPSIMTLSEVSKDSIANNAKLHGNWTVSYSAGATSLANRLFVDETGKAVWSGVATKNGLTGIRLVKTTQDSEFTDFDLLISIPTINEIGTDICRYGFGYAVTGSTNQKSGQSGAGTDTDILFKRLAGDGTVLSSQSFPFSTSGSDNQNDTGNSISATQDGGLIILSSVNSAAIQGKGDTDYFLIKVDAFGQKTWSSSFGSIYKDDGTAVRQTSDGGYAVLGTTTQGGLKLVTLIKTNAFGQIL